MKYIPKFQKGAPIKDLNFNYIRASEQDNTKTVYNQAALNQLTNGKLNAQKEQDYQDALKTKSEIAFKEKYGISPHRYKYDSDPQYKAQIDRQAKASAKDNGAIDLPSSDLRRKDVENPATMWMNPNLKGESNKVATNFHNEVIGAVLPVPGLMKVGKIPGIIDGGIELGSKAIKVGKELINPAERLLTETELLKLNKTLSEKGILSQQKTLNLPWKNIIHKTIQPWGYGTESAAITGNRINDILGYLGHNKSNQAFKTLKKNTLSEIEYATRNDKIIANSNSVKDATNNLYKSRFNNDVKLTHKNRYSTWGMYLGKPQTEHPLYAVSPLSTNKKTIYTIKPKYTNQAAVENELKFNVEDEIVRRTNPLYTGNKEYKVSDSDHSYFGTMGGFHWKINSLENGNVQAIANDVWDLNPLQRFKLKQKWIPQGIKNKIEPLVQNIEAGKILGIGKPLDVKVGFEFDKFGKIIRQFEKGGIMKFNITKILEIWKK